MNIYCRPMKEGLHLMRYSQSNETVQKSLFGRRPQNGLKENIIMKQGNDEKQASAHFGVDKNSRSNYSLLDHFHNEPVLKKSQRGYALGAK